MFSLQRLLGQEDKFFSLLQAGAEEARTSIRALVCLLERPDKSATLDGFVEPRRNEKRIANEISDALCSTFVTAFEREDIEALSQALYRIPKTVEKVGERTLLAPHLLEGVDLSRHIVMLESAITILVSMITALRQTNLEQMRSLNAKLQEVEGKADDLMLEVLGVLYSGKYDARKSIFLKDIYELLEKVVDRCRDAGNVLNQIALKNS